ncbi:unnamed protein product, partial [Ectocarpus fasciculatus]
NGESGGGPPEGMQHDGGGRMGKGPWNDPQFPFPSEGRPRPQQSQRETFNGERRRGRSPGGVDEREFDGMRAGAGANGGDGPGPMLRDKRRRSGS